MKKYLYRVFKWVTKGVPVQRINAGITLVEHGRTLNGHKILITGGSRGIGYALAKRFIAEGAEVVIVGRSEETLQKVVDELGCKYLVFDVTDVAELPKLVRKAAEIMGGLTGLVNNAGICNVDNGFLNVTEQSYDEQFLLNVKSPFFLTQAFVRYVTENEVLSSSVLFVTSERGLYPDDTPYGMTKAALGNIIAGIARRYALQGVHVNGIAPGVTADTKGHPEMYEDLYLKGAVGKRYVVPEELAEIAVFLMSNASKCVSGEIIPCNQANHYK